MSSKQKGAISTLSGKSLKLGDHFTYLGSNISSTESDVNIRRAKALTTIERLSILSKSDMSYKIKWDFFQVVTVSIILYGCTTWTQTKHMEKKLDGNYWRILRAVLKKYWKQRPSPPPKAAVRPTRPHSTNHPSKANKISCWRSKRRSLMDFSTWTYQYRLTSNDLYTLVQCRHMM